MKHIPNSLIKIAYFGSNDFSAKVLSNILLNKNILVKYIVTKKDKKVGRGGELTTNSLVKLANSSKIPVFQVSSLLKDPTQLNELDFNSVEVCVVVSFAYILPYDILRQVKMGFINLHPSLLPKYRGPSPIQSSISSGDAELGITIMLLDEGMDTGPSLSFTKVEINSNLVYPFIEKILIEKGSKLLIDTLKEYVNGRVSPVKQNDSQATVTKIITKEDGFMTFKEDPIHIYNNWRAFYTWPGIYTTVEHFEEFIGFKL